MYFTYAKFEYYHFHRKWQIFFDYEVDDGHTKWLMVKLLSCPGWAFHRHLIY